MKFNRRYPSTFGVFFEERRMLEGLMSLWTTHLSVPLCRYATASAIPMATLYLTDHGSEEPPFTPFFFPANVYIRNNFNFITRSHQIKFPMKDQKNIPCKWRSKLPPETYLYTRKRPSSGSIQKPTRGTTFELWRELAIINSLQNAFADSLSSLSNRLIATAVLRSPTLPLKTQLKAPLPKTLPKHHNKFSYNLIERNQIWFTQKKPIKVPMEKLRVAERISP